MSLQDCPGHIVLARLGERWATLLVASLADGPRHHGDLRREHPQLTQKMLTQTLRGLERDGFVDRCVETTVVPARVRYSLTGLGRQLLSLQRTVYDWAEAHVDAIRSARQDFDTRVLRGERPSVIELNRVHRG
ncbi:winged helix-turn-helix transcriptional regulator [Pseudonocardia thermophila]|uniref:winged helix-turn-helix transcriptional regulator n=1 Tax=Pseudonocardia thermophila TaxID=1848 RepID=UPI00190ED7E2|nr:helix-turn-helix domain-containing protein [Pseudonocardia thermophila]